MKPILIIYGTVEGQTRKIASFIGDTFKKEGFSVELLDSEYADNIQTDDYSAVIAGASVHMSRFPAKFTELISKDAKSFSTLPTAFFSVCLGALQKDEPEILQAERDFVSNFFLETGWQPDQWAVFPGALLYSKYGWFKRHLLHLIVAKAGRKTDTEKDYEFTDWEEVRKFSLEFAKAVRACQTNSAETHADRQRAIASRKNREEAHGAPLGGTTRESQLPVR